MLKLRLNLKVFFRIASSLALLFLLVGYSFSSLLVEEDSEVTLEFKIGQMLMVGFRSLEVSDQHPIIRDIREIHLGGVLLSDYDVAYQKHPRNIESPAQVSALTNALQQASTVPLLIAIDYEGGVITRLKESSGFPSTVSHQYLGALNDCATTYRESVKMAETLAAMSIVVLWPWR